MPLISVIMPSYNHEHFIAEAIESVLGQTVRDLELVIIDDASTDESRSIIEKYSNRDERVITAFHEENKGIAKTVNEGLGRAQGKYIAFLSSDDVWMPEKLEKQLNILSDNENLVVWSEGLVIDSMGKSTGETFSQVHNTDEKKKSGDIFEELIQGNFIFGSSMLIKSENIEGVRFNEDLKYLNDFQFNVDLAGMYNYYYIPEPLAFYRVHDKNTITADREGHYWDYLKLGEYFLTRYGDHLKNSTRIQLFLASLGHLKMILFRREELIDEITGYARSLEDTIHRRDAEINTVTIYARSLEDAVHRKDAEINTVTIYARSLEDTIHRKDADIGEITAQLGTITNNARSFEESVRQRDSVIGELNSRLKEANEHSLHLEEQMTAIKRSFSTWLRMRK